jgi:hypothetical protein
VYYRLLNPMNAMVRAGLGYFYHDEDPHDPDRDVNSRAKWNVFRFQAYLEEAKRAMENANVYLTWFDSSPEYRGFIGEIKEAHARGRIVRPTMIWDCDDNSEYICPFNPAFATIGTRTWDGTRLQKGDRVTAKIEGESEVELWADGQMYDRGVFDVERNWNAVKSMYENARAADGVTVASKRLKDWYEKEVGCENVYLHYNSITPEDYGNFDQWIIRKRRKNEVRVFWQGGASHFVDLMTVKPALDRIAAKYDNVKFVVMGQSFPGVWKDIPDHKIEHVDWVDGTGYRPKLNMAGFDINIAPLKALEFNLYKSACKFYESSVLQMPAVTLAADYGAYQDEIVDGETGMLYAPTSVDDFQRKLEILINEPELRRSLAMNAKEWVLKNRLSENVIKGWADWVQETRRSIK